MNMPTVSLAAKKVSRSGGFTLVELLIAVVLSLFLVGALSLAFLAGRAAFLETETLARTQENLRFASDFLVRDIRNAGFRDQLTLNRGQFNAISECFASYGSVDCDPTEAIGDRTELVVRYAGVRACGLDVVGGGDLTLVQNRYLVVGNDLVCIGQEFDVDADGNLVVILNRDVTVQLATGVAAVEFQLIFPPAPAPAPANAGVCDYLGDVALESACTGVEVTLTFAGNPQRTATLTAAFRNPILDRLYGRE